MGKLEDAENPHLTFDEQASAPTTPATGMWKAYFKSDGLYVVDDAGVETGPFGTGGGGGSSELVEIDEVSLASSAASISFSSIPATYKDLLIVGELRSDRANLIEDVYVRVGNGTVDSGSNYRYNRVGILHSGSAFGSNAEAAAQFFAGSVNAASGDTGSFGPFEMTIMRYADTARWRHMTARAEATSDATGMRAGLASGVWQNTANAIDIVTILPAHGTVFIAGSYLTLYGRGLA